MGEQQVSIVKSATNVAQLLRSDAMEERFKSITSSQDYAKEVGFAIQIVQGNDKMVNEIAKSEFTRVSLMKALYEVAMMDITLNPNYQHAYLIMRRSGNKGMEIQLEPSYKGLIEILSVNGAVNRVWAEVVYKNDQFTYNAGANVLDHFISFDSNRGDEYAVYAAAELANGSIQYAVLGMNKVNTIMETSQGYKAAKENSLWSGDFRDEMIKKTAVKQLFKYLPKHGVKLERAAAIIAHDNENMDMDFSKDQAKAKNQNNMQNTQEAVQSVMNTLDTEEITSETTSDDVQETISSSEAPTPTSEESPVEVTPDSSEEEEAPEEFPEIPEGGFQVSDLNPLSDTMLVRVAKEHFNISDSDLAGKQAPALIGVIMGAQKQNG